MPGTMLTRSILWTVLVLAFGAAEARAQHEDDPFEEDVKRFAFTTIWDFRFIQADKTMSWLDGGLGKARYGGDGGTGISLFRIAQASFVLDNQWTSTLNSHAQVNLDLEPENAAGRYGWDRFGLVELFLRFNPALGEHFELRAKGGLFFPPISLENIGDAWSTFYTVSPSAINAWGEEVRATGVETSLAFTGIENELSVTGAGFWNNDPIGSLLAYRGFTVHDRQTRSRDQLPLPPVPSPEPGGDFEQQAPWVEPMQEIDHRPGYYAAAAWENFRFFELNGIYFDNRGIPEDFDGYQYAWKTRFFNVGAVAFLPAEMELFGQFMDGRTEMGFLQPGAPQVSTDFSSGYLLFTAPFAGRHRFSLRYERFRTRDLDGREPVDTSNENGSAWTIDYLMRIGGRHRLAFELLRIDSDRMARLTLGEAVRATENVFQLSLRIQF